MCNWFKATKVLEPQVPLESPVVPKETFIEPYAILTRLTDTGKETIGTITVHAKGRTMTFKTLELSWKKNQHNISCIPLGQYACALHPFHETEMYQLTNVSNRTGIFIHPGNYHTDSLGCILLGVDTKDLNADGQVDVTQSVNTIAQFVTFLNRKPFTLIIK